jgi:hypothetical protein
MLTTPKTIEPHGNIQFVIEHHGNIPFQGTLWKKALFSKHG